MGLQQERAVDYLLGRRKSRGRWEDFDTLAGSSTQWVSAYVGLALAQTGDPRALAAAREAWSRLRRRRWRSAGWAYNGRVPADADSTVWAMRASRSKRLPPKASRICRSAVPTR